MSVSATLLLLLSARETLDEDGREWLRGKAPELSQLGVQDPGAVLTRLRTELGNCWTPDPATADALARAGVVLTTCGPPRSVNTATIPQTQEAP